MEWFPDPDFQAEYFRPRPITVRDTRWEDWPRLEALYSIEEGWFLRSIHFGQWGRSGYEGEYISLRKAMREGGVEQVKVMVAEGGAVVGQAYLSRDRRFLRQTWLLDLFVHPNYYDDAHALLGALELDRGAKVQCYVDSTQPEKAALLEHRGFRLEATLPRQVQRGDEWLDVSIYAL
jgi:hypothetical protein